MRPCKSILGNFELMSIPPFFEDTEFLIANKVCHRKMELANKAIPSLMQKHLKSGKLCSVADIRDAFVSRNCGDQVKKYHINDFVEEMDILIDKVRFHVSIPLFPKRAEPESMRFELPEERISRYFRPDSDPESVVDLLTAIASWMPEYYKVEDIIREEEKKKRIACDLAYDLVKRSIGGKLEGKGYRFTTSLSYNDNSARLEIEGGKGFEMTMHVDLLENFLEDMIKVVDSLPSRNGA